MRVLLTFTVMLGMALTSALAEGPVEPAKADGERIAKLIAQLGSESFNEREEAGKALEAIGWSALEALRKATISPPDLETRRRAEKIVQKIEEKAIRAAVPDLVSVKRIDEEPLRRTFPEHLFFKVNLKEGSNNGNAALWVVHKKDGKATRLGPPSDPGRLRGKVTRDRKALRDRERHEMPDLKNFLEQNLPNVKEDAALKDALGACLLVAQKGTERWSQVAPSIQDDSLKITPDKEGKTATGKATAGKFGGFIGVTLSVDHNGKVRKVEVVNALTGAE